VLELDPQNPSMAANLAVPLTRWRRYDPQRGQLMRGVLTRMAGAERLSKDLYEVLTKSLAEPS
jgi:aminopeptidase N